MPPEHGPHSRHVHSRPGVQRMPGTATWSEQLADFHHTMGQPRRFAPPIVGCPHPLSDPAASGTQRKFDCHGAIRLNRRAWNAHNCKSTCTCSRWLPSVSRAIFSQPGFSQPGGFKWEQAINLADAIRGPVTGAL